MPEIFTPQTPREQQLYAEIEAYHHALSAMITEVYSLLLLAYEREQREGYDAYSSLPGFVAAVQAMALHPEFPCKGLIHKLIWHFLGAEPAPWPIPDPLAIVRDLREALKEPDEP